MNAMPDMTAGHEGVNTNATADVLPCAALLGDASLDAVVRFNLFPAEYADASWLVALDAAFADVGLAQLLPSAAGASRQSPIWVRHLSTALLAEGELDRQYDFDYSDTGKRTALLPAACLLRMGQRVVAMLARPALRRLIRGAEVAAVDAVIGRELRLYSLAQQFDVAHIATGLGELCARAEAATRYADIWALLPMQIALSVLPENASGTRARLRFKFPYALREMPALRLAEAQRRQLVQVCLLALSGLTDAGVDTLLMQRSGSAALTARAA